MSVLQKEKMNSTLCLQSTDKVRIEIHEFSRTFPEDEPEIYRKWQEVLEQDQKSTIQLNPELILKDLKTDEDWGELKPVLFLAFREDSPVACAVLTPKSVPESYLLGWKGRKNLTGFKLAGNRIPGEQSLDCREFLLNAILDFVHDKSAEFLLVDDLESGSLLDQAIQGPVSAGFQMISPSGLQDHHWLNIPENPEEYWSAFKSKTRNTLKRKLKKMGEIRFSPITHKEDIPEFLLKANQVSLNTWQTQELGLRIENNEEERKLLTFLAERGWLRAYLLEKDSDPVAFIIGTHFHGTYYLDELGFDRKFSHFSPGTVLFHLLVNDLLNNRPPEVLDFGLGDGEYKKLFGNHITQSQMVALFPPGWKSTVYSMKFKTYVLVRTCVKNIFSRFGSWKSFRKKIKDRVIDQRKN